MKRTICAIATSLLLPSAAASAEKPIDCPDCAPVLQLGEGKPTQAKIASFLKGGTITVGPYTLRSDGFADYVDDDWSFKNRAGVSQQGMCRCQRPAAYQINSSSISLSCTEECWTTPSTGITGEAPKLVSTQTRNHTLRILYVSQDSLVISNQQGQRWGLRDCTTDLDRGTPPQRRQCRGLEQGFYSYFVEIIPASKNVDLHTAVRTALHKLAHYPCADSSGEKTAVCYLFVFEGPPAARPRDVTEIYYSNNESMRVRANEIARHLESATGAVSVASWPGAWDYDVIVVVGNAKQASPACSPPPNKGTTP